MSDSNDAENTVDSSSGSSSPFDECAFPVKVLRERFGELKCQLLDIVSDRFLWLLVSTCCLTLS